MTVGKEVCYIYSTFWVGCPDWVFAISSYYHCCDGIWVGSFRTKMARPSTDILCGADE